MMRKHTNRSSKERSPLLAKRQRIFPSAFVLFCFVSSFFLTPSFINAQTCPAGVLTVNNSTICLGQSVILTGSGAGVGSFTYSWSPTGGTVATVGTMETYTVTPSASGSVSYSLSITDNGDASNNCSSSILVNVLPSPTVNITGPTTTCSGSTVVLDAGTAFSSYMWSHNVTGPMVTVGPGTYTVTVTSSNGCTATDSHTVGTITAPTPTVASVTVCPGTAGVLNAGTYASYSWSTGATTQTISVQAGNYSVTVTDANGCTAAAMGSVVAQPNPSLGNVQICPGGTATLDAGTGSTYAWSNGAATQTITVGQGTYSVTVTSGGCTASSTATVTEVTSPTIGFTVTEGGAASDLVICNGGTVNIKTTNTGTGYSWSNGMTGVDNINVSASGTYTVTVTTGTGCTGVGSVSIVNGQPTTVMAANPGNTICAGTPVTFSAGGGGTGAIYQLFINNVATGGATTSPTWSATSLANGDQVWVQTTNSFGCTGPSDTITMTVNSFNPILVASPSHTVCAGTPVTYIANGAGSGGTYEFFVNGISQGVQSANFLNPSSVNNGDVVSVNIANINGCSGSSTSITMTVNNSFVAGLTSSASTTSDKACINDPVTFTATGGGTGANYQFFLNDVSIQGPSTTATYTTSSMSNLDTVHVEVTSAGAFGCTVTSADVVTTIVDVVPTLTATNGSTTFCAGEIVTFIAGGGSFFEFFVNNISQGGVSGSNSFTTNTLNSGDIVKVRVGSMTGCLDSMMMNVAVTAAPTITITPSSTNICTGTPVTYTATGGSTYQFFMNGVLQTTTGNTYTVSTLANGDIISVSASNGSSCSASITASPVTVTTTTLAGSISGTNSLCQGSTATLSSSSTNTTGTWLSSNNSIATVNSSGVVTAIATGTANITYTVITGSCTSTTPAYPIFVSSNGSLTIGSTDADNAICAGESVTLSASAGTGANYTWTSSTGGTLPNTASITVTPSATTTYTLTSSGGGCAGTSTVTITVNTAPVAGSISGATAGGASICEGAAITLSPTISGTGTVIWSSSNPSVASINASTGVVTASSTLTTLPSTTVISYTYTQNGCTATSPAYQVSVVDCTIAPPTALKISVKAILEGPYDDATQLMNDDLRLLPTATTTVLPTITGTSSPFPLTEPYTLLPNFSHTGGGGNETTTAAVLATSGANAIVDWVFLELRSATDNTVVLATKSALIQRDGDIVDAADGISPVCLTAGTSNYHLVVRHRNHVGIMSRDPINFTAGVTTLVDMSTTNTTSPGYMPLNGTNPTDIIGNRQVMWGGDANSDGQTIFTGPNNDRDEVFFEIFFDPTNTTASYNHIRTGYYNGDTNLDGQVKYQGPTNDLDRLMFFNVLFYPGTIGINQIISEQIP